MIKKMGVMVSFKEGEEAMRSLREIAKKEGVSVSRVIRTLVRWGLEIYRRGKRKIVIDN